MSGASERPVNLAFRVAPPWSLQRTAARLRSWGFSPSISRRERCREWVAETQGGKLQKARLRLVLRLAPRAPDWVLASDGQVPVRTPFLGDPGSRTFEPGASGCPPAVVEVAAGEPIHLLLPVTVTRAEWAAETAGGACAGVRLETLEQDGALGPAPGPVLQVLTVVPVAGSSDGWKDLMDRMAAETDLQPIDGDFYGAAFERAGMREPGAPMPETLGVSPGDSVAAAARKIVAQQVLRMKTNLEGTRHDLHPEFLHDLRVAVRRLRSALRLLGPALGPRRSESLRLELRWIGGRLGAVRDRDVLKAHLLGLRGRLGAAASVLDALLSELALERAEAREALEAALDGRRFASLMRRLEALAASPPPVRPSPFAARSAAEAGAGFLRKAEKPVMALGSSAVASVPDETLHRLRILVKRLRYTAEFFGGALPAEAGAYIKALVAFQDCLGEHQDAVVALGRLEAMAEAVAGRSGPEGLLSLGAILQVERDIARERREALPRLWPEFRKRSGRLRRKVRGRHRTDSSLKPSPERGRRRAP